MQSSLASTSLAGRVALVTGSSRDIGRALATQLHQAGAAVALGGQNRDRLDGLASELGERVAVDVFDVGDRESVDREVPKLAPALGGRIDILVNNAGINGPTPRSRSDDAMGQASLAVNLHGPMYVTPRSVPSRAAPLPFRC